jgi:aminocarboxymuconate-semialdehyde decarboxylase
MRIDIHAHVLPIDCFDAVDSTGRHFGPGKIEGVKGKKESSILASPNTAQFWDLDTRIQDMDATGVEFEAISVIPTVINYDVDAEAGLWYSRRLNNGIARMVKEHSNRFVGIADVPLQNPKMAVAELDRAVNELGMRGVQILANINGRDLDSPELAPFYQEVQSLDVPVFIHPRPPAGTIRMNGYHLINLIGNPLDTTLAAAHLVFGGILDRFPNLKFCLAHAGGEVPYLQGRWEHGYQVRPEAKLIIKEPPSKYLPLFYFDTITHSDSLLEYLIKSMGADKVLLGTDYPFDMADSEPVARMQRLKRITEKKKQMVLGGNAARLLKLAG